MIVFSQKCGYFNAGANWLKPRKNKSGKVEKFLRTSIINKSRSHRDEYQGGLNLKPRLGTQNCEADAHRAGGPATSALKRPLG
jgi:hypothetical protein